MIRKKIFLLILLILLFLPSTIWAEDKDTIIVLVDELPFDIIEELSFEKYSMGLVNYKTRPPYYKENLLLSLNTGRKLSLKEFYNKNARLEYLGDQLKDEKLSYIGNKTEKLLIANSKGEVDFEIDEIVYDVNWLISNTNDFLRKSNILLISYDFNEDASRISLFKNYLEYFNDKNIIILPEKVAEEDKILLNRFIVPILFINGTDSGILTSQSTKREGFIALEDFSVHVKSIYGISNKSNVGKALELITVDNPLEKIKEIYTSSINLLILATIFHGLIYLSQFIVFIIILKNMKINYWIYLAYCTLMASIPISILLAFLDLHNNIVIYIPASIILSYGLVKVLDKRKIDLIKYISLLTYTLIVLATLFYPKILYNSFIGFNNVFYGARFYGLNNGIMGVLLVSSILSYYSLVKGIKKEGLKKILGLIFALNILVLSARFGANTGGFITSVILFGLILVQNYSFNKKSIIKLIIILFLVIGIFAINMLLDYNSASKSHAIEFLNRIMKNGLWEFMSMLVFKAKELFKLTVLPPFSIVLISQVLILRKMMAFVKENLYLKNKLIIVSITAIVGMLLNDTGSITFIYIMFFFILDLIIESKLYIKDFKA